MSIVHILLYRFKPEVDRIDEHFAVIRQFRENTNGLLKLECGRVIRSTSGQRFTHGFTMTFESADALREYAASDAHRHLVESFRQDMEDKLVIDIECT